MQLQTISIKEYLTRKGIGFKEQNGELITHCVFNNCDSNSRDGEAHLYFNAETGQYNCKKCGEKGNIITLAKYLGDSISDIAINQQEATQNTRQHQEFDPNLVEKCHQALPTHIRQYLNRRGITDAIINGYKLGWGEFYGKWWITIPIQDMDGNFIFLKLRKDPQDNNNPAKFKFYPMGSSATLYGLEALKNNEDVIVVCEGEFDQLVLSANAIPAITSTAGAGTFKKEWIEQLKKLKKIYICFDKDETGKRESEKLVKLLSTNLPNTTIYEITLPDRMTDGKDITDYFTKYDGNPDELIDKLSKEILSFDKLDRIRKIEKPNKEVSFEEWRETINKNFPELLFPAEIGLSIISQILIKEITNPFSLVLVDVPSAGKTIAINFFSGIEELTYATDKFTPASFVSNAVNVKKEKLKDIDLLPRLKYKMFLIRDLATIFSKRDDDLNECLGLLTRVLDGEGLNTDSGVHGQRQYIGEYLFMILAGSTPIPPRVWKMMGSLGSRLFFLNMGVKEKSEEELAEQITTTAHKEKERICRIATKNFLYSLWYKHQEGLEWDKTQDSKEDKIIIARCARLLAKLRGVINVWKEWDGEGKQYSYYPPTIEQPNRINQLFYNLCRGHALVCNRTQINKDDLKLIVELAIDSSPTTRAKLFRKLLENNGIMKTGEIMSELNCSRPTALKEMETLKILGVCSITQDGYGGVGEPEKEIHLAKDLEWFLSEECEEIRNIRLPLPQKQGTTLNLITTSNQ